MSLKTALERGVRTGEITLERWMAKLISKTCCTKPPVPCIVSAMNTITFPSTFATRWLKPRLTTRSS